MQTFSLDLTKKYSFFDYLTWINDVRCELVDGFVRLLMPAPLRVHQELSRNLSRPFVNFLHRKECKVYAPFDVRFPKENKTDDKEIFTVLQPDICVICDLTKLDERGCLGAPDLVIEIVSSSTSKRDTQEKFDIYEKSGVKEYWLVFPYEQTISVFVSENNKFILKKMYAADDEIPVCIFNGSLVVDLKEVFIEELI